MRHTKKKVTQNAPHKSILNKRKPPCTEGRDGQNNLDGISESDIDQCTKSRIGAVCNVLRSAAEVHGQRNHADEA